MFIIVAFLSIGFLQLGAEQPMKETPMKIFASAFKHIPGLDKDAKVVINKVRKEFKLYYKEEKDRKYYQVALDLIDEDADSKGDFLYVYFMDIKSYKADVTRITLGQDFDFEIIEANYKPGAGETSAELAETYDCVCPDPTVEVLLSTCETGIPTAVAGINTSYDYAVNAGYVAHKLMGSEENTVDIKNWMCCPNLIYWGRIGHGATTGIYMNDGMLSYTYFDGLAPGALSGKVFYFNSCEVFNDPLKASILDKGALKYTGGICNLYIGPSEDVFMCWNLKNFNQITPPISTSDEMCYWSVDCESSTGYPQIGCHGCGGPGNIFPLPGSGGLYHNLAVTTVGNGTVTLNPPGGSYEDGTSVTLTANPATDWSFTGWSVDLTGVQNPESIVMNANKNVTATFTCDLPGSITVISPNGGESWRRRTTQTIQWSSTGDITNVQIFYYYNGNWNTITSSTANDGSYSWSVPNLRNVQSMIKIVSADGLYEDVSDGYFTIAK